MSIQPHTLPGIESPALVRENEALRTELRHRAQTDPEFLSDLLGYDRMDFAGVHRPVRDLFIRKEPDKPIEYWTDKRESLQLDPRGTYKSTADMIEAVQLIVATGGEVRICVLTATKPVAAAIAGEITDHFVRDPRGEEWSLFQALFPEFLIAPREKRVAEYTAPCRKLNWREATVMAFSIETTIASWHFDAAIIDDVVETVNSSTPQSTEKVKKNYRINKKTLMPWGFTIYKGTRYGPFELWGDIIDKATPGRMKVLIRGALKLKDGQRLEPGEFPARDEMELLFPELLSYDFLKQEFEDDYESFMTQYMNDAAGGKEIVFAPEDLLGASLPAEQIAVTGQMVCAWRFACASKPGFKYAAGAAGIVENGRLTVLDVVRGKFTPSGLAHKVVQMAKRHGAHTVEIEDTPGARYSEAAIQNYAAALQWPVRLQWLEFQEDDGERDLRIKSAEPLLPARRLAFAENAANTREMFRQFKNYGMIENNEIPDVVSRLCEALPRSIVVEQLDEQQDEAWRLAHEREMFDRIHGLGRYAPPAPVEAPQPEARNEYAAKFGLPDILGGGLDG